jgi:formamidopyrimidine-DNA glycosylase
VPELPDITLYIEALEERLLGEPLVDLRLASPFLLRSVDPPPGAFPGRRVEGLKRLGKRIVVAFEGELYAVLHLMIAGRLRWRASGVAIPGKHGLAAFDFGPGSVLWTEASSKKRASLHLVAGVEGLAPFDRGGLEVLEASLTAFIAAITRENHTLKRSLTDPRILSGIGNAYSDEILHRAGLSPMQQVKNLADADLERLFTACREVLEEWTERLRADLDGGFPETVTAFHAGMAVHGRYGEACPNCGTKVMRIRYATNECNYCPRCQTGGRLLADRALSRLLKRDWPRSLEELEARLSGAATKA